MNNMEKYVDSLIEKEPVHLETPPEAGSENTSDLIRSIVRRWYVVLLVFIIMCGTGLPAIWFFIKPVYSITGAIRVAPIITNIITGEENKSDISNYQSFMNTQAEIITSDPVLQRVADDLVDKNLTFFKKEQANIMLKLKQKLDVTNINSDPVTKLKYAISNGIIDVVPARHSQLMKITMQSRKQEEAKKIVDALIRAYMAVEVTSSAQDRDRNLSLLENEQKVLAEKLQSQHQQIQQLAEHYGTTNLVSHQDMKMQRVTILLSELTKIEARRINLEAHLQFLEQTKEQAFAPKEFLQLQNEYTNSDPTIQELTRKIIQMEEDLIVAKQDFAPKNPALEQKQQLLDAFKSRLEEKRQELSKSFQNMISEQTTKNDEESLLNTQTELEQARLHEIHLREVLAKEEMQTTELGRTQLNIQDLEFQSEFNRQMYDTVMRRIRELELEQKCPARITVLYNAGIASVQDRRGKLSAALLFGALSLGCGLALLKDKINKKLRAPNDITKHIDIRIIGTTTSTHTIKPTLLPAQIAGDYQNIRANLGLFNHDGIPKKLVVTSPGMREGKTTFAINFATSIAKSGKKVLLIDGDLRKPDIAYLLNLPKGTQGLQNIPSGIEFSQAVYSIHSTGLNVLASHSCNGIDVYELISSPLTIEQINKISQSYDNVIIDTPPMLAFPETLVWAKIADAVILTSFTGQTTATDLKEAKQRLTEINVRVLGTVLSNVPAGRGYYRYDYNYYAQNTQSRKKSKRRSKQLLLTQQANRTIEEIPAPKQTIRHKAENIKF